MANYHNSAQETILRSYDIIANFPSSVGQYGYGSLSVPFEFWTRPFVRMSQKCCEKLMQIRRFFRHGKPSIQCESSGYLKEISGVVCWNCQGPEQPSDEPNGIRQSFLDRVDRIVTGAILTVPLDPNESVVCYLRIPRDLLQIYRDKDPDCLRKLELSYCIRIFWGRDFERFRDHDKPSAPRGLTRICFCGRPKNVSDARLHVLRWIEFQADFCEEELTIPEYAAGNVIGRQGTRIAQMQVESRAKIDVMSRDAKGSAVVKIFVSGRRPARNHAKRLIQRCVDHSERMRQEDEMRDNIRDVQRRIMYAESDDEDGPYQQFPIASYQPFKSESGGHGQNSWNNGSGNESAVDWKEEGSELPACSYVGEVATEPWD